MDKILITGGTGLIGGHLQAILKENNFEVNILSRNPTKKNEFYWNISENHIDKKAFEGVTHIIHLAGAGIADKRWTNKRKGYHTYYYNKLHNRELIDFHIISYLNCLV